MFEWNPPKPPRKPRPKYRPMRLLSDRPWGARGTSRRKLHPKNWKLHGVPHRFWPRILSDGHKLLPEGRGHSHKRECFWCRRVFYTEIDIQEASSRFCCTSCQRYFANYAERHRKRVWLKDLATRCALIDELHARPFAEIAAPCDVVFLACKHTKNAVGRDRAAERSLLADRLVAQGLDEKRLGNNHFLGPVGDDA